MITWYPSHLLARGFSLLLAALFLPLGSLPKKRRQVFYKEDIGQKQLEEIADRSLAAALRFVAIFSGSCSVQHVRDELEEWWRAESSALLGHLDVDGTSFEEELGSDGEELSIQDNLGSVAQCKT